MKKNKITLTLFKVEDSKLKVFLIKDHNGYWKIPINDINESFDKSVNELAGFLNFKNILYFQDKTYMSDNLYINFIGFLYYKEGTFFDIHLLPKMNQEHKIIVDDSIASLKNRLQASINLKQLFPGYFTLPELQKVIELLYEKKYDRRNFRKKLIKSGIVKLAEDKQVSKKGRPAYLYELTDIEERYLWID
jgi:hypothetical protein